MEKTFNVASFSLFGKLRIPVPEDFSPRFSNSLDLRRFPFASVSQNDLAVDSPSSAPLLLI